MALTTLGSTRPASSRWGSPTISLLRNPAASRLRLAAIVALILLISVSCGGSGEGSEASTSGARGEAAASQPADAGEVASAADAPSPADDDRFVVGVVMPTARDDSGFSQSLVDALTTLDDQGQIDELKIADNTILDEQAVEIFREYAADGVDLIFGHGPQYGGVIAEIASDYPNTAFAWGFADETFGLNNVSAYDAAAGEGAYVLGHVAARVVGEGSVALIGPRATGDDKAYIEGFFTGIAASGADMDVVVQYIESYVDVDVASERARESVDNEADVLVSSSSISPGVIAVADDRGLPYFGNQVNSSALAPDSVVASQVYRWEIVVADLIDAISAGDLGGEAYVLDLNNGGLVIEYNPGYELSPEILTEADALVETVKAGGVELTLG